jgi:hypothetical protein
VSPIWVSRRAPRTSSTPAPPRPRPFACRCGRAGLDAPAVPLDRRARCSPRTLGRPARKSARLPWSTAVQLLGGAPPPSRRPRKDHGVDSRPPRSPLPASGRRLGRFAFEELLLSPSIPSAFSVGNRFAAAQSVLTREPFLRLRRLLDSV